MSETQGQGFEAWAVIELLGHRRLAGRLSEQRIADATFLRIDIPLNNGENLTQFYGPGSIYGITPVSEEVARSVARNNQPQPVHCWELPARVDGRDSEEETAF